MANQAPALERRTEKLDVRVSPSAKAKLQAAARALDRSMRDFVMESALLRADETLADLLPMRLNACKRDWLGIPCRSCSWPG